MGGPRAPGGSVQSVSQGAGAGWPAVGIDVGGTKMLAVRLDEDGSVLTERLQDSPASGPELLDAVSAAAERLAGPAVPAIGLGVPGLVDARGTIRFAPNLHGIAGTDLACGLRERLPGSRVWIGNDATAACWAEHAGGAAAGCDDVVMVTLGTGIGGGIISRGRLLEGSNRFAGEFGHMVVDPHGPRCPCGKRGCWERFASGSGLGLLARETAMAGDAPRLVELAGGDPEAVRGEHVTVAAADGDPSAIEIMGRFAWWVAVGLANLANALDPEMFVIGGGLIGAGEVLMEPTRRAFEELVEAAEVRPKVDIVAAELGYEAGAIGAALLASAAAIDG